MDKGFLSDGHVAYFLLGRLQPNFIIRYVSKVSQLTARKKLVGKAMHRLKCKELLTH